MSIDGGSFREGLWYDYCMYCNTWYPEVHKCKNPPPTKFEKLFILWHEAPPGTLKKELMLRAWVRELGAKIVSIEPL